MPRGTFLMLDCFQRNIQLIKAYIFENYSTLFVEDILKI